MKLNPIATILGICLITSSSAQIFPTDSVALTEIKKLQFMTGTWAGNGWMMGRDGNRHDFNQEEKIEFKLDSMILVIEGTGKSDGKIIHNAFAVISFNRSENTYDFQSYLEDGRNGKFKGELIDNIFYWYPAENIRYVISLNESGDWHEMGEMNRNGSWIQFFGMTLKRNR